jgi:hypothetical protein
VDLGELRNKFLAGIDSNWQTSVCGFVFANLLLGDLHLGIATLQVANGLRASAAFFHCGEQKKSRFRALVESGMKT